MVSCLRPCRLPTKRERESRLLELLEVESDLDEGSSIIPFHLLLVSRFVQPCVSLVGPVSSDANPA